MQEVAAFGSDPIFLGHLWNILKSHVKESKNFRTSIVEESLKKILDPDADILLGSKGGSRLSTIYL